MPSQKERAQLPAASEFKRDFGEVSGAGTVAQGRKRTSTYVRTQAAEERAQLPAETPLTYRPNVGIMIVNKDHKIWVGKRSDADTDHFQYAWQMPQGGIDADETLEHAAWREMREETGLTPAHATLLAQSKDWFFYDFPPEIMGNVPPGFKGQQQKWFLFLLNGDDSCFDLNTYKHIEFTEFKWLNPQELPSVVVPFKREVYEQAIAEFMPIIEKI